MEINDHEKYEGRTADTKDHLAVNKRKSIKEHFNNISLQFPLRQFAVTIYKLRQVLYYCDFENHKSKDVELRAKTCLKFDS